MFLSFAQALGGSPITVMLYVKDCDQTFRQAVDAGARAEMEPQDMFWGDRFAKLEDPFGHRWGLLTAKEKVSPKEMARRQAAWQEQMKQQQEEMKKAGEKNKKDGEAFLAANAKKDGVKTLPSGLQYKVIASGKGATPKATDTVETNYRGTLIDGTEFDSSYKRGQPAEFPLANVIKCWTEGVQKLKVGGKGRLVCPSEIAYGKNGAGAAIPPNATLVFEVELLDIVKK